MWVISDKEMVQLQNRMNDLWEADTRPRYHGEYIATANRLVGTLYGIMNDDHYYDENSRSNNYGKSSKGTNC